jgi:hypothetical protein
MIDNPRALQGEDWQDYRHLVVAQLETMSNRIDNLSTLIHNDHLHVLMELSSLKAEVSSLQVKASFYGALAGLGAGMAIFLAQMFGRHP